ncbi:MAG: ComEA family DNA-binding protein [Fluviicola sp.]
MQNNHYSKSTTRGVLVLAGILIIAFVLPDLWAYFKPDQPVKISMWNDRLESEFNRLEKNAGNNNRYRDKANKYSRPPAKFDPNKYTLEEWMALGLSEKQAAVILKFTRYGIRSNDDLKRIFVIDEKLFALIKDSTIYSDTQNEYQPEKRNFDMPKITLVDINTATVEELQQVKGVGPFFAKQIVKYRDALGGFHDERQLLKVWKVDEEKFAAWKPYIYTSGEIKKLSLNEASWEELEAHPLISWNLANSIVKLRLQNGPFKRIEDVKRSALMNEQLFEELKWYLSV